MEQPAHDAGAAGVGQELAVIADQAARGHMEGDARLGATRGPHVHQLAAAQAELLYHDAGMLVVDVDLHLLDWLEALPRLRVLAEDDPRAAAGDLEALAAHGLDQNAELELAAPRDLEGILALALAHLDGDIALRLAQQAGADHAAGHLVALAPGERGIVHRDGHGQRRRIDRRRL